MRRIVLVTTVAAMMVAMLAISAVAWAAPPLGGGGTGCEAGQRNAYFGIGTGYPSGELQVPYRDNPSLGVGPGEGFDQAEDNTLSGDNCL